MGNKDRDPGRSNPSQDESQRVTCRKELFFSPALLFSFKESMIQHVIGHALQAKK